MVSCHKTLKSGRTGRGLTAHLPLALPVVLAEERGCMLECMFYGFAFDGQLLTLQDECWDTRRAR